MLDRFIRIFIVIGGVSGVFLVGQLLVGTYRTWFARWGGGRCRAIVI